MEIARCLLHCGGNYRPISKGPSPTLPFLLAFLLAACLCCGVKTCRYSLCHGCPRRTRGIDNRSAHPNCWVVSKCSLFPPIFNKLPTNNALACPPGMLPVLPSPLSSAPPPPAFHSTSMKRPVIRGAVPAACSGGKGRVLLLRTRPLLTKSITHPTSRDARTGSFQQCIGRSQITGTRLLAPSSAVSSAIVLQIFTNIATRSTYIRGGPVTRQLAFLPH